MWLQAGLAALPKTPVMLYVEIARAGHAPVFLPLAQNVPVGKAHRLAILEMNRRPGVWRVWLDGEPATDPIVLEGSHRLWKPIVTAETWNGGVADVQPLRVPLRASRRRPVARGLMATVRAGLHVPRPRAPRPSAAPRLRRQRTLASDPIEAYAFDALSS